MDTLDIQQTGFGATNKTWRFLQKSYLDALNALAKVVGDKIIVSGLEVDQLANTISDGFIIYNGEILPFEGGTFAATVTIIETIENATYDVDLNGDTIQDQLPTYKTRIAKCATGGVVEFPFSDLRRIETIQQMSFREQIQANWQQSTSSEPDYIKNKPTLFSALASGTKNIGDVVGDVTVTVTFQDIGTTNYIAITSIVSNGTAAFDNDLRIVVKDKTASSFKISLAEASGAVQSVSVDYILLPK